jgi:hypothetical protein
MGDDLSYQDDISTLWASEGESLLTPEPLTGPAPPIEGLAGDIEETLTAVREEVTVLREELAALRATVQYQRKKARKSGRRGRTG